jgi:phenylpropionate dioxygenase-like ring-hydroxylating dioxygenase large terminal subunit
LDEMPVSKINRRGESPGDTGSLSGEPEKLRLRQAWNFLGFTAELPEDGDWLTRDLWGWSVFVQRFGSEIKAFENRCAHRFFPLRNGAKDRGPVRCGFHGWDYDRDGKAVGIPMC